MPSNTAQLASDGKVRCRLVNDELSVALCEREQNATDCVGCTATTRRCTACGKARGVADPTNGWCGVCVAKKGGSTARALAFEGTTEDALRTVVGRVRAVSALSRDMQASAKQLESTIATPPVLKDPEALLRILTEHATEHEGVSRIRAPMQILIRRMHLLRHEAESALSALVETKRLQGAAPWEEVILLKMDGVEETRGGKGKPHEQSKAENLQRRRVPAAALEVRPDGAKSDSADVNTSLVARLPSLRPLATYGQIYAHLLSRSSNVRGERLVGGAIPALQIRFKLNPAQATESLEWLLVHGHVQQKDVWRTLILLSKEVVSDDGPLRPQQPSASSRPTGKHIPSRTSGVTHPQKPATTAPSTRKTVTMAGGVGSREIEEAIAQLDRALPALREKRDEAAQQIAQLETALALLHAAHKQWAGCEQGTGSAAVAAAQAALAILATIEK